MVTIKAARRAAVPLVAIETADAAQTISTLMKELNGKAAAVMCWDIVRALVGLNNEGRQATNSMTNGSPEIATANPTEFLKTLASAPAKSVTFMMNAHLFWTNETVLQAVWNLRDVFKQKGAMLVMLAQTTTTLPEELKNDVVVLEDSLPTDEELDSMVNQLLKDAEVPDAANTDKAAVKDSLLGLSGFGAENNLAMSIVPKDRVDLPTLTARQIRTINATKGLSVYRGKERRSDLAGMSNAYENLDRTVKGTGARAVVLVDEIDKDMAASATDSSGTTQYQLKGMLTLMQDKDILGALLLGPPGTGKTFLCKVVCNENNIPLILMDLGGSKGSLVGQSEQQFNQMVKVILSITGGKVIIVGTCNRTDTLRPELRRRFSFLSLFCDLATEEEKVAAWKVYCRIYSVDPKQVNDVDDTNWTAAEIRNCCLKASMMKVTLAEAAKSVVPVAVSAADEVERLRKSASGKFTAANYPGVYYYQDKPQESTGRRMMKEN